MARLYVVTESGMVLNLQGGTLAECDRSIRWQRQGGNDTLRMHICRRIGADRFASVETGAEYVADQSVYTLDAWRAFLDSFR